jgi:4-hydroxy-2-oxoheptanedioate aldolase
MNVPKNRFKEALGKRQQLGVWSTLSSNLLAELFAGCGFDWILFDTEHSPNELPDLIAQLQAISSHSISAVVRPAWSDMILVKRILDAGAQTLLFPNIQNAEEARAAVSFTRYPPGGVRGVSSGSRAAAYGLNPNYVTAAQDEICVLVQIETGEALHNLEDIADVPGVDGVFIGPADLAASLGHLGNAQHQDVQAAIDDAFRRLRALGKAAGYLTTNEAEVKKRVAAGVEFIAIGTDVSIISRSATDLIRRVAP